MTEKGSSRKSKVRPKERFKPFRATSKNNELALWSGDYGPLLVDITEWLENARKQSGRAINALMTATYWRIGQRIFEQEQRGRKRAGYGEQLVDQLARDLTDRFGRGFSRANVFLMRQFFLAYRGIVQTPSGQSMDLGTVQTVSGQFEVPFPLSWSHYVRLLSVADDEARNYYEREALRGGWSVRDLDRQIATKAYHRLRRKPRSSAVSPSANDPDPELHIRDPFVLEFLDLKDEYSETDLEQALIQELEGFLLELGNDFAFVARQKRLRIGTEWYRVDLLFFHRRLRCLLIVELKVGKFTHADAGQMNLYLNYARQNWVNPGENPPVGLILCSERDAAVAHYSLEGLGNKVLAREYELALPDEDQLSEKLASTRIRLLSPQTTPN
jgi:predicted nuclease of restriction endonuclease-like (RecB) superfamily